jgi:uncharacterized protein YeaO (DUF488 family)
MTIKLKRVYEPVDADDGYRVLVDRLWPRGLSEEMARVDLWLRRIAPTTDLRKWYGHDVAKWPEFRERYREELAMHAELLDLIGDIERHRKVVTLLFAAKDEQHNEANVIVEVLKGRPSGSRRTP